MQYKERKLQNVKSLTCG